MPVLRRLSGWHKIGGMRYTRRQLGLLVPAFAAQRAFAQTTTSKILPSTVFLFNDLKVKDNGKTRSRAVFAGETHTGFPIESHITELAPGESPHPPHHHPNEEAMFLQRGFLDATVNGKTTRLTLGSVFYVASNDEHSVHNPGPGFARYFVIELGNKKE